MSYDIVSFDLDGTLVDTAAEIAEAANRALESHGIERRAVAEVARFIGHGTRELILRCLVAAAIAEQAGHWRTPCDSRTCSRAWITTTRSPPARWPRPIAGARGGAGAPAPPPASSSPA